MNSGINEDFLDSLPLYSSGRCSYWNDRESCIQAFRCSRKLSDAAVDLLLEKGYRRCGDLFYSTACAGCSECISYRIVLKDAEFTRSQKRILKKGGHIGMKVCVPSVTDEKRGIYLQYQKHKHRQTADAEDDASLIESMNTQMFTEFGNSVQFEFYDGEKLAGFVTADKGEHSLSAVYSVYDVSFMKLSPGKLFVLKMMEWAKEHYDYLYLGFYIRGHEKMDYKSEFGKAEILDSSEGRWISFSRNTQNKDKQETDR